MLQRYLAGLLLSRWLAIAFALAALVMMLDLMANAEDVLAADGARLDSLPRYMALRAPVVFARIFPFSLLLAALVTLVGLALRRELVAMMAAGVSQLGLLAATAPVAVLLACVGFVVADQLATRSTEALRAWGVGDYTRGAAASRPLWLHAGADVVRIGVARAPGVLEDVAVFERDAAGGLTARLDARRAVHEDGAWWLEGVARRDAASMSLSRVERMRWPVPLAPAHIAALAADPRDLTLAALKGIARRSGLGAYPAHVYDLRLQRKFAEPAVVFVILVLTVPLVQRCRRPGDGAAVVGIGLLCGFVFFAVDGFLVGMGEAGLLPPPVAAWAATVVCALIGLSLLVNRELR